MTCRSRHLKCDEGRPACRRCVDSRRDCAGYPGYRAKVQWKPVRGPLDFASATHACDAIRIYSSGGEMMAARDNMAVDAQLPPPTRWSQNRPTQAAGDLTGCRLDAAYNSLSPFIISFDSDELAPSLPVTHLDRLDNMHRQRQLVEHWLNYLCDALMPIPGPSNPFRNIFVPIANAGARSSAAESSGSVALFYLICSAAAFHLSGNAQDHRGRTDFMTLALFHHSKGIRHLQHNLAKDDVCQRDSILASLLLCLTHEPATADSNFWSAHLRGAAGWLHRTSISDWNRSESTAILYQSLVGTAIFLRSQLLSEDLTQYERHHFNIKRALQPGPYRLYEVFGLCKTTLELVCETITIASRIRHHKCQRPESCELESASRLDRMEMELYLAVPQNLVNPEAKQPSDKLRDHYAWIFYFGSIIYFKRSIRNCPPGEVQTLIEQSLGHIEALGSCTSRPFSPFVWPIAVAFLEAQDTTLQERAVSFLDFIMERSTVSIWRKTKSLVCSFWAQRSVEGQRHLQWDEFLSDPNIPNIMLV